MTHSWEKAWADVQSLRPIIEAHRDEAEQLRRLPDPVAAAFLNRDIYRITLPEDLGGMGITPSQHFDLIVEVSRSDASAGWLYWLAGGGLQFPGKAPPEVTAQVFATADCGQAAALAPTGRAVAVDGGYRVSGRWAWASGIHHAPYVGVNCLVFDGDKLRLTSDGQPTVLMAFVPKADVSILDTWDTGGMRGTGSTEFKMDDHFVPAAWVVDFASGESVLPHPIFKLPPYFFAFGVAAVAVGVAYSTVESLKDLSRTKRLPPSNSLLAEQTSLKYTVAKCEAMIEAVEASVRTVISRIWDDICTVGEYTAANRLRLRRALTHAVDECIVAVSMCYRAAGGSAVHRSHPFERALRDIHALGAHVAVQRSTLETAGGIVLGVTSMSSMF